MHHDCPDEETLAAYFDGLLSPGATAALHAELVACPQCARLVAALGLVIAEDTPAAFADAAVPAEVTQRAMDLWPAEPALARGFRLAVRWIEDRLAPLADALMPETMMVMTTRGEARASDGVDELCYQVTLGEVPLEIDLEVDGPQLVALSVRPLSAPPAGLILRLTADGETCAMSSLTGAGASVPALASGDYLLSLERGGDPLGQIALVLAAPEG